MRLITADQKRRKERATVMSGNDVGDGNLGDPETAFLKERTKLGVRRRWASVIETASTRTPSLVPRDFRNPMSRKLVGRGARRNRGLSKPPVSIDELVRIVAELDQYSLGLLCPLFLFAPRPSELGRILAVDIDASTRLLCVMSRPRTGYRTKGKQDKFWPVSEVFAACIEPHVRRAGNGPLFVKRRFFEGRVNPALLDADENAIALEYDRGRSRLAHELQRPPAKEELDRISKAAWTAAGAVSSKTVYSEFTRAARRAGLAKIPTAVDVRHLFEPMCEAARLAPGVIRHLMGHRAQPGDALHNYSHTWEEVLRQQVAELDALRRPLIDALRTRACDLGNGRPQATAG